MKHAFGGSSRLIKIPAIFIKLFANLVGKLDVAQSLCGPLQVSIEKTMDILGWSLRITLEQGLKKTASFWLSHND